MPATIHRISTRAHARQALLGRQLGRQTAALYGSRLSHRASLASAASGVMDFAEHCVGAEEQVVGFSLMQLTAQKVQQIEAALRRLAIGEHGTCSDCRLSIPGARLRALPFAALCLGCQERFDGTANGRGH